jgi:hypothetical protein
MNWPFDFTFAAQNDYGVLWNPHGLTTGADKGNGIYLGLPNPLLVGLVEPQGDVYVSGIVVMGDDTAPAAVTLGYYDTALSAFVPLYRVRASGVAGGGVADIALDSLLLPLAGGTRVACLRNDTNAAGSVSGHLRLYVPPPSVVDPNHMPLQPLTDEDGDPLFDETHHMLLG